MSVPPPQDPWSAQSGPPGFGGAGHGQPFQGPPPQGYQQTWPAPPNKGGSTKWLIAGVLVAVIAVAVAVIVVVLHTNSSDGSKGPTAAPASGVASANDNGPVTIITEDPTCAPWTPIINTLTDSTKQIGWDKRDVSVPASSWTPEQHKQYQDAATAMLSAADQTLTLVKLTPHRVMRELYEQSIAYWHAYADSIASYTPIADKLARVTTATAATVTAICDAIAHGSAAARAPMVTLPKPPTTVAPLGDPAKPDRFIKSADSACKAIDAEGDAFNASTAEWQKTDGSVPVARWSASDKALNDAFVPVMNAYNDKIEQLGRNSGNPTLEDFVVLTVQYGAAFVKSFPTYAASDQYLYTVTTHSSGVISAACEAVGG